MFGIGLSLIKEQLIMFGELGCILIFIRGEMDINEYIEKLAYIYVCHSKLLLF